ncbi:MAG TPA: His/Gly/Thr/Pro-type tRNA ligase C-terminal domain-containing protein, partial [Patescibacteria group bacterium]|nr:His/Gly/Thr/Pro-type tRNA ligase C-terminal domain-containing protein [Patescibacteria group bacterium]
SFYEKAKQAYLVVFSRCGLKAKVTEASGGSFTKKVSHEFQVETPAGEDALVMCRNCHYAQNTEIATNKEGDACPDCKAALFATKGIEVGNIFDLSDRFSKAFDLTVAGPDGARKEVIMGCYGIGVTRLVGAIVEASHDDKGMIWPKTVAPFHVHLVSLAAKDPGMAAKVREAAEKLERDLESADVEVLHDDREDVRAGEKFADADLIGLPVRLVVSEKSLAQDAAEWKDRKTGETRLVALAKVVEELGKDMAA